MFFFIIDKYIFILPSETKQPGDWAEREWSLEGKKNSSLNPLLLFTYTIYSSTVILLCQTWQRGLQIWWHDMANRSNMYMFLFFTSKDQDAVA